MKKSWFIALSVLIFILAVGTRFWQVTSFPPSLYWEEIALGYDAYSVLKTGKDHFGNPPPLVAFESYGDYKPALYFYLLLPSIAVFGLNEFSVRLPAMIAGVLIVIGVGIIARLSVLILKEQSRKKDAFPPLLMQCIAMAVTAVSPWAVQFSRAAWEVNVATCFIVWGVVCGLLELLQLQTKEKQRSLFSRIFFPVSTFLFFGLSMYTYHSARMVAPLLALGLLSMWVWEKTKDSQIAQLLQLSWWRSKVVSYIMAGILFVLFVSPILLALQDKKTQQRFAETSLFADQHVIQESNALREAAGNTLASRIFYHRYVLYTKEFLMNYLTHFQFDFLFVHGDENPRHSVQYFGQLYIFEVIFILFGFVFLLKRRKTLSFFLIFWLVVGVIPAGLTKAAPHALRILPIMPVSMLLISFGIVEAYGFFAQAWQNKRFIVLKPILFTVVVAGIYAVGFIAFWRFYSLVYPKLYASSWQYGYRQIATEVEALRSKYPSVSISREMDRPAMAYWFFTQADPSKTQQIDHDLQLDVGPALTYENITFINFVTEAKPGLVATSKKSLEQLGTSRQFRVLKEILNPDGKVGWVLLDLE